MRIIIFIIFYAALFNVAFIHAFEYQILLNLSVSLGVPFFITLILPTAALLSLVFPIVSILYAHQLLSYSVAVTSDGKIIESQTGTAQRTINIKDISEINTKWLEVSPVEGGLAFKIPRWIRESFFGFLPRNKSLGHLLSARSVQFVNNNYSDFPRQPISWQIINDLRAFNPNLKVNDVNEAQITTQQSIFTFSTMILFICFTLIFILLGIFSVLQNSAGSIGQIFNSWIILGIGSFFITIYYWRKRYK